MKTIKKFLKTLREWICGPDDYYLPVGYVSQPLEQAKVYEAKLDSIDSPKPRKRAATKKTTKKAKSCPKKNPKSKQK